MKTFKHLNRKTGALNSCFSERRLLCIDYMWKIFAFVLVVLLIATSISERICLVKEKGDDIMRKQVQKFWKLDWEQEDKMESLMILGYLTFEDYKTQSTVYYDVNNDCIPVNENIIKNGARNLSGDYFYGTKEQFTRFLNYKL